jgi:hypothetical protein
MLKIEVEMMELSFNKPKNAETIQSKVQNRAKDGWTLRSAFEGSDACIYMIFAKKVKATK